MARELDIVVTMQTAEAERAAERVDEKIAKIGSTSDQTSQAIDDAAKRADASIARIEKKYADQEKASEKAAASTQKHADKMGVLESAVLRYAGPAVIGVALKQTLAWADSIEDLSKKTGVAPGKLQALEFSAKQVGLAIDPVARAIGMMGDRLASGDKSALAGLERLGLSFKTIRSMSPDAAFLEIAKAIAEVEDPMQRAADATDLFGRTGIELLPLLTSDIDELMKKAKQLGLVMDDETTKAAADLNDQLENMVAIGKRLLVSVFLPLIPILNPIANAFGFLAGELNKMIVAITSPLAQMREFAELLGVIQSRLPNMPKGPGMTFDPGMLGTPGDPMTSGVFGQTYDFVNDQLNTRLGAQTRKPRVLPFVRPDLMGESAWNNSAIFQAQQYGLSPALSFPGWQNEMMYGPFGPMAPFAGAGSRAENDAIYQNRPNAGSGFLRGSGGRFLSAGLGSMASFIPGMNHQGSAIGSSFGSALGGLQGVMGALGSFAPFLGPIAGIAGGLLGKLFGPSEASKTRKERSSFIDDFGGMESLQLAADRAGFNLDKLLSTKKTDVLAGEIKKLEEAMAAFDQQVADANTELDTMYSTLDATVAKGKELGYEFDQSGNLVSVNFQKMQETAQKYKIDLEALGPAFQQQRLHAMAEEIINDFTLLNMGGTETGTILLGMSEKINELVNQSIKYGTEIPANMKPWIENLIEANQLTDENGVAITDLSQMKFGETVASEFSKIQASLVELVDKIGVLVDKITEMTAPKTIHIGWQVDPPPDIQTPDYNSMGGFVGQPRYLAGGGMIPRGTDTVPAMLTPGEGVMRRDAVARLMRGDWPQGGGTTTIVIDNMQVDTFSSEMEAETQIGRALVRGLKRRGVRLNAA